MMERMQWRIKQSKWAILFWCVLLVVGLGAAPCVASPPLPQLDPPGNIEFTIDYEFFGQDQKGHPYVVWDAVPESDGSYEIAIKRDGVLLQQYYINGWSSEHVFIGVSVDLVENGVYTFDVRARGVEGVSANSDWASVSYTYVRPSNELAVVKGTSWDPNEVMTATWLPVAGAQGYWIELEAYWDGKLQRTWLGNATADATSYDFKANMLPPYTFVDALSCRFRVRAYNDDILILANGLFSAYSALRPYNNNVADMGGQLETIATAMDANTTAEEIRGSVENIPKEELLMAMYSDASGVLDALKGLEQAYMDKANVNVNNPYVAPGIDLGDVSKINILGAAFNTEPGGDIGLRFTGADPRPGFDHNAYTHALHLEISLSDGTTPKMGPLDVPIQITMPVPPGFSKERIHILHYRSDGEIDTIWPRINGDGTMSFCLLYFSDFDFVETPAVELRGDVSGNGVVDLQDVLLAYQYFCGKADLSPGQIKAGDVVGGGDGITMQDVLMLYGYFRGQIETLDQPRVLTEITVSGPNTVAIGGTGAYSALYSDQDGEEMADQAPVWSIDPAMAGISVDVDGVVTVDATVAEGTPFTVKATVSAVSGAKSAVVVSAPAYTPMKPTWEVDADGSLRLMLSGIDPDYTFDLVNGPFGAPAYTRYSLKWKTYDASGAEIPEQPYVAYSTTLSPFLGIHDAYPFNIQGILIDRLFDPSSGNTDIAAFSFALAEHAAPSQPGEGRGEIIAISPYSEKIRVSLSDDRFADIASVEWAMPYAKLAIRLEGDVAFPQGGDYWVGYIHKDYNNIMSSFETDTFESERTVMTTSNWGSDPASYNTLLVSFVGDAEVIGGEAFATVCCKGFPMPAMS